MSSKDLGQMMTTLYGEFLALYGNEEMASVVTAAAINDILDAEDSKKLQGDDQVQPLEN